MARGLVKKFNLNVAREHSAEPGLAMAGSHEKLDLLRQSILMSDWVFVDLVRSSISMVAREQPDETRWLLVV
ncbi:unnamed protein product [Fusarium graminearum]|nr:unnamed protein product [Fusarium graminearum]